MKINLKNIIGLLMIASFAACSTNHNDKTPLAKVNNVFLYKEDVLSLMPKGMSEKDSVVFVSTYIKDWAKQQLLLQKAKINLTEEEKTKIEDLVNNYHKDLLANKYLEAIIKQELDTVISREELENYYKENKEIFNLKEALLKFRYIAFNDGILNKKELTSWFRDNSDKSNAALKKQALQLNSFHLNDTIWVRYDDIKNHSSFLGSYNKNKFLKKNRYFKEEDSVTTYLVEIKDVLLPGETAPFSYAVPTINSMLLHKRKLQFLRKIEETIINDAIKQKELQLYD
ncbi:MAG: peptidylprolyl isomerase [Flavobacteriales bacterium]|nr:MAG: peptidylprolyl isomerase [Flavobacteriales bacterium]